MLLTKQYSYFLCLLILGLNIIGDDKVLRYFLSFKEFGIWQNYIRNLRYEKRKNPSFRCFESESTTPYDLFKKLIIDIKNDDPESSKKIFICIDDCLVKGN